MERFFNELLDSREARYFKQRELIEKYGKSLISFMLNVPGIEKQNDKLVEIHKIGIELIKKVFSDKINYEYYANEHTGMYYLAVVDMDSELVKYKAAEIENSEIGRLFDIDVFSSGGQQISRTSLNLEPRKCILCDENARICIKERTHSYPELIEKMDEIIDKYLGK